MTEPVRPKVVVLDDYLDVARSVDAWRDLGHRAEIEVVRVHIRDRDELAERLAQADVLAVMRERTAIDADLLHALPRLRLIATSGMVNAAIDLDAATRRGIVVSGTSSMAHPTVELTWGLILATMRGIPEQDRALRSGTWQTRLGRGLRGRRLGVIGVGRNGGEVARIGLAFGMDVVAWSHNLTGARAAEVGVRYVERDELLRTSDIVTIHLRLSQRTMALIGHAEFALMRPTAVLVNTSRGPIVDESALVAALSAGRIAGAGLDVYDEEPLAANHPLLQIDTAVLTPHLGYVTHENMRAFYAEMAEDVVAWLDGSPVRVLNPEAAMASRR